jgi:hypothetical protein
MLPAYQNGALNKDLLIKRRLIEQQKRAYSVMKDVQLIQSTGDANVLSSTIETNLVVLNALLAESLTYFTFTSYHALDPDETAIQEGMVRPALAANLRQILISANQFKQNLSKLQPLINYVSRTDIDKFINLLNDLDDRYQEIFYTAGDVIGGLDETDEQNLNNFLSEIEKNVKPIQSSFRDIIKSYSPYITSIPLPSSNRNLKDGGYSLADNSTDGQYV